ncbi:amidohydrolase family protein [Longirhabdus pacifica]|uniref:amidohydrolase family protein n=1 Tax=Longirhabdus pacifica TaxID=2305227 RepID=UPI001008A6D1|nr:amidohydrolase family protein [Longirhabdus pacifica]
MKVFDAHFHIIDPRFPLVENQGYLPPPFTVNDYVTRTHHFDMVGGAIVSGSFQALDQRYLVDSLQQLGNSFVGVTQLPATVSDEQIQTLHEHGVRAIRFNVKRGGSEHISQLEYMAKRVHDIAGWHTELYMDAKEICNISSMLSNVPSICIDHLGLSKEGFPLLLKWIDKGVRVKATGFGRVDFNIKEALKSIVSVNPNALMFGTDLPSTRAPIPFQDEHIQLIIETLGEDLASKVLYKNAMDWYKK